MHTYIHTIYKCTYKHTTTYVQYNGPKDIVDAISHQLNEFTSADDSNVMPTYELLSPSYATCAAPRWKKSL